MSPEFLPAAATVVIMGIPFAYLYSRAQFRAEDREARAYQRGQEDAYRSAAARVARRELHKASRCPDCPECERVEREEIRAAILNAPGTEWLKKRP